jgi:arylsulfatase A-like enzyme
MSSSSCFNLFWCAYSISIGGTKVDSFVYSSKMAATTAGTFYDGLVHVSDWLPTIIDLAGITTWSPKPGFDLDGFSHANDLLQETKLYNREYLLYNAYSHIETESFDLVQSGSFAIRNRQYKLLHAYLNNPTSLYYDFSEPLDDDNDMRSGSCPQFLSQIGMYTEFVFDLKADPYETTNLVTRLSMNSVKVCILFVCVFAAK